MALLARPKLWVALALVSGLFLGFRVFLELWVAANQCGCLAFYLRDTHQTLSNALCSGRPIECVGWQFVDMGLLTLVSVLLLPFSLVLAWRNSHSRPSG